MDRLQRSIERLYTAFGDIPKPRHIDGCPCCLDGKGIDRLLGTGLREISPEELSPYAASAFLTVGDVADYLYFLPRILEISAIEEFWWPDPEVTGKAISSSKIESWPAARRNALADFLGAVIETVIARDEHHKIDGWMCAIARMGIDVQPYLDMVASSPQAVLGYFDDNARCLLKGHLCNAFWELPCEGHDVIVNWFRSEAIRQFLRDAYGFEF